MRFNGSLFISSAYFFAERLADILRNLCENCKINAESRFVKTMLPHKNMVANLCHIVVLRGGGENAKDHHAKSVNVTVLRVAIFRPRQRKPRQVYMAKTRQHFVALFAMCRSFAWRGRNVVSVFSCLRFYNRPCKHKKRRTLNV